MAGKGDSPRPADKAHLLDCREAGHAPPDIAGRCLRCGARWWPASTHVMVPDPEYVPQSPSTPEEPT